MFWNLLRAIRIWYQCRVNDLHAYAKETSCGECGPKPTASRACPDCGRKIILTVSVCCDREMWLHPEGEHQ